MLNELYELTQSQNNSGISDKDSWSGKYHECYPTIRILLNEKGQATDFEVIRNISDIEVIRMYEPAYGQAFPAFNIKPLYWAGTDDLRQKIKGMKKQIEAGEAVTPSITETIASCSVLWDDNIKKKITKCFKLAEQCSTIIGEPPQNISSIAVLAERISKCTPDTLLTDIKNVALKKILQGDRSILEWLDKFLLCTIQDKIKAKGKNIAIVCDLSDRSMYSYPPTHDIVQRWFNNRLLEIYTAKCKSSSDLDAFGSDATGANVKKFPPATVPRFRRRVILRAMTKDSPCQKRYGRADAASFCVGKDIRQNMKNSLEWLGKEERKNLTWRDISGVCGYTKQNGKSFPVPGVLFAYPSILSGYLPPVPTLFAGEDDTSDPDGSRFAAAAKRVIDGLSGILKEKPDVEIRIFVLTEADRARTKLLISKHYTAIRILAAAEEWQAGCHNIPQTYLNIGTKDKAEWITPLTPFPTEVVKCLNVAWYREGKRVEQISGVNIADGISLLLEGHPYAEQIAKHLLGTTLRNTSTLFLALAHAGHREDGSFSWERNSEKNNKDYAKHAIFLPSILGLLLHKLGYTKGVYMNSAPFLVGQMMSLADTLHKEYCRKVRGTRIENKPSETKDKETESVSNGLPRQLIGNSAMSIAMDNPAGGLARLTERILIYQAWANTASGDIGYAGWALAAYRRISKLLGEMKIPERCTDADKAQLLLGYLSKIEDENTGK